MEKIYFPKIDKEVYIDTLIFDFDDTLVDSTEIHIKAWIKALKSYKLVCSKVKIRNYLLKGMTTTEITRRLGVCGKLATEISQKKQEITDKEILNADFFPDVPETLTELKRRGYRLAIVSQASGTRIRKFFNYKCQSCITLFSSILGRGDTKIEKPSHQIIKILSEIIGVIPKRMIYVGNNDVDRQIAYKTGIGFIFADLKKGGYREVPNDWAKIVSFEELLTIFKKECPKNV